MSEPQLGRQVRRRLAVLRHVEEVSGNVAMTCRDYGISRPTRTSCHADERVPFVAGPSVCLTTSAISGPGTPDRPQLASRFHGDVARVVLKKKKGAPSCDNSDC